MKKKWITILAGALFFSAAGAFYYEGRPEPASANEEQIIAVMEQASKENEAENVQEPKESIHETTTDQPSGNEKNTEDEKATTPAQVKQPAEKESNKASKPETIKWYGDTYHLIEETEYPNLAHLIDASAVINASLYGIKNSDVFILVVDGKVIGGFSVGVLSIEPEYKEYAIERLSYYQDKGLKENIDLTIRTGAKIKVEFPKEDEYYYYSIELSEGRLIFHFM